MPVEKIRRRDGEIIPFDRHRIEHAIELACDAIAITDKTFIPTVTDEVIKDVERVYSEIFVNRVPTVEDIQDIVERELVKANHFDLAKTYILYREERKQEREERHERLVREFEERTLKVTKADGSKEYFDMKKLRAVFDRASKGYEEECRFEDLMDSFKKNLVDDIKTSDIEALLVKTCVDLVTVENILWQNIAARILLGGLYKKAIKNRGLAQKDIYSAEAYKTHFDDYVKKEMYFKDFYQYYSAEDILEAGHHLSKETDESYEYTTIVSFIKRYLLNPNKIIRELPQEMYMSVALFLAIPEEKENRLPLALKIYEHCSKQR
ncbi:MAG: ATP cone domain-containing protein, partial [Candidatus Moraniibacteriota bacterium]